MKAGAFCPGHVTGFFIIEDESPNISERGSRGAGFCTALGATSEVEISNGHGIRIIINDEEREAPVTRAALAEMLGDAPHSITAKITLELPEGQGFGMSAAGTFASSLALANLLELENPKNAALRATHFAEIEHKTGLGDAVAQSVGGFVLRKKAGLPPFGIAEQLDLTGEVLFCILGEPLKTSLIISDTSARQRIIGVGCEAMGVFENSTDIETFVQQSWKFARKTELASQQIKDVIGETVCQRSMSMAMLGNTLFAIGDTGELAETLGTLGQVIETKIDEENGARIIHTM